MDIDCVIWGSPIKQRGEDNAMQTDRQTDGRAEEKGRKAACSHASERKRSETVSHATQGDVVHFLADFEITGFCYVRETRRFRVLDQKLLAIKPMDALITHDQRCHSPDLNALNIVKYPFFGMHILSS